MGKMLTGFTQGLRLTNYIFMIGRIKLHRKGHFRFREGLPPALYKEGWESNFIAIFFVKGDVTDERFIKCKDKIVETKQGGRKFRKCVNRTWGRRRCFFPK